MRVFVYFNLHRKVWSIKALEGPQKGRVVAHAAQVALLRPEFRVSEAGRQRVLQERRKNVHAGVVGLFVPNDKAEWWPLVEEWVRVSYNPYAGPSFTEVETHARLPVRTAQACVLKADRKVYAMGLA